jgi:hypothetical protein
MTAVHNYEEDYPHETPFRIQDFFLDAGSSVRT